MYMNKKLMFKGYLKLLVLAVLERGPQHAYGIIKELEKSSGFKPSPGALYPILKKLLKEGLIEVEHRGGEPSSTRIYKLTNKGREFLELRKPELDEALRVARSWKKFQEIKGYRLFHVVDELLDSIETLDEEKLSELKKLIAEFEINVLRIIEG
jgi:DNA-binding PadR family transcriptional regulator